MSALTSRLSSFSFVRRVHVSRTWAQSISGVGMMVKTSIIGFCWMTKLSFIWVFRPPKTFFSFVIILIWSTPVHGCASTRTSTQRIRGARRARTRPALGPSVPSAVTSVPLSPRAPPAPFYAVPIATIKVKAHGSTVATALVQLFKLLLRVSVPQICARNWCKRHIWRKGGD